MTNFSSRDLAIEAGVRRHGVDYLKSLSPVAGPASRRGWGEWTVREPFPGAWQRNIAEKVCTVLCYPTLYACLNRLSSDIGKLPFLVMREGTDGIWSIDNANTSYWPVLLKPNHYQTAQQFREAWMLSKLISGNTYVLKERDNRGVVTKLYVLDPCRVIPMVAESGDVYYQINYTSSANLLPEKYPSETLVVPASEIIHDRLNCFHHQLIGVPPVCAANWPAVKNLKILKDATTFFSNGANPGGILTAPAGMSEEDATEVKVYWNTNFQGENSGKVAVIGADMKFTPFAFKSADSQMVEQMEYSDQQICQPFGIPPYKVGIGSIPAGMKVDDLNQLYYSDALQTHVDAMENLLDEGLGVKRPQGIELDLEPLLRMDVGKQADVETKLVGGMIKAPNEARRRLNLKPLDGGDTVYGQQQDYPLSELAKNTISAATPAPEEPSNPPQPEAPEDGEDAAQEVVRALSAELFMIKAIAAARTEALQ